VWFRTGAGIDDGDFAAANALHISQVAAEIFMAASEPKTRHVISSII
jgi:hypothetical protein